MGSVLCVGIDPAPSFKGSAVVEYLVGDSRSHLRLRRNVHHPELRADLERWKQEYPSVLLAWDAPLTGPQDPESDEAGGALGHRRSDFTIRQIEKEIRKVIPTAAEGISVIGYSGCPHWTITRNLLGLPRVGPFDQGWDTLPYSLLCSPATSWPGHYVLEVHPALALWAWLKDSALNIMDWRYKAGSRRSQRLILDQILSGLVSCWDKTSLLPFVEVIKERRKELLHSNDLLDALVAAALATLFIQNPDSVELQGSKARGAMLLPIEMNGFK